MRPLLPLLAVLALVAGCERADRPARPLPADFRAQRLDGSRVDAETLRGRPWVVSLWAPG